MLATHAGDESPAANASLGFEPAEHAQQRMPGRQPVGLALQQPPEHHAITAQQDFRDLLQRRLLVRTAFFRTRALADQTPATRILESKQRNASPADRQLPLLVLRNQQGPQSTEAVGIDHAGRDQLTQRRLRLGAQQTGAGDHVVEERGAMRRKIFVQGTRAVGQL